MSWALLWMLLNTFFGIKLGLLFLDEKITIWHGIYYIGMIASFVWVWRHVRKKWKNLPDFTGED
jgi:drug/metabolite transporter (DMT)-like permease